MSFIKNFIQKAAWKRFPAQEIWIRDNKDFWAFSIETENSFTVTDGKWIPDKTDIEFETRIVTSENPEKDIQSLVDEKIQNSYECFCIEMRE